MNTTFTANRKDERPAPLPLGRIDDDIAATLTVREDGISFDASYLAETLTIPFTGNSGRWTIENPRVSSCTFKSDEKIGNIEVTIWPSEESGFTNINIDGDRIISRDISVRSETGEIVSTGSFLG